MCIWTAFFQKLIFSGATAPPICQVQYYCWPNLLLSLCCSLCYFSPSILLFSPTYVIFSSSTPSPLHLKPHHPLFDQLTSALWPLPHITDSVEYTPSFNPNALKDSALSTHKPIEVRGPGGKATIVHAQYNTPISMYSQDAIMDAIAGQSQAKGHERWGHTTKLILSPNFVLSPTTHCSHTNQTRPLPKPTGSVHPNYENIHTFSLIASGIYVDYLGFICPKVKVKVLWIIHTICCQLLSFEVLVPKK